MDLSNRNSQMPVQKQKLALTAELKESLKILQMPLPELLKKVEDAVQENPLLEYEENRCEEDDGLPSFPETEDGIVWEPAAEPFRSNVLCSSGSEGEGATYHPLECIPKETGFTDDLLEQLLALPLEPSLMKLCRYVVGNLDESGYLSCCAEELARSLSLPIGQVERALRVVQGLEPVGVGAADLRECLTLQLRRRPDCDSIVLEIVNRHLDLVAQNKIKAVAETFGISVTVAQKYFDMVRSLNPIPSNGYDTGDTAAFVIPEAVIRPAGAGRFTVRNNGSFRSRLRISACYRDMTQDFDCPDTEQYMKSKMHQASAFIREVNNREKTINRVLEKIINRQCTCFEKGSSYLTPMSIRDIAESLGLHESTVSRAIQNKYILYPYGIAALKSFFTSKIAGCGDSEGYSSSFVKQRIRILVAGEMKDAPLSDQNICDRLNLEGMKISRRTVAKYRDELQIPAAAKRRIR